MTDNGTKELFVGDMLATAPDRPMTLIVRIDTQEASEYPNNPFTLNAYVHPDPAALDGNLPEGAIPLYIGSEGRIVHGDVPTQLRELADAIEHGEVTR